MRRRDLIKLIDVAAMAGLHAAGVHAADRAANLSIEGPGIDVVAAQRADELMAVGEVEGQLVWKRILIRMSGRGRNATTYTSRRWHILTRFNPFPLTRQLA